MVRLQSLDFIDKKDEAIEVVSKLIELKSADFYKEVVPFLNGSNHKHILDILVSVNKSTLLMEEVKLFKANGSEYSPLMNYNSSELVDLFADKMQLIDIDKSEFNSIIFSNEFYNDLIKNFAENKTVDSELSELDFIDLKDAGLSEYSVEIFETGNKLIIRPIKSVTESSLLNKIEEILANVNDAIIYSTKNIKPHHVKIGVAMFGVGLAMFGQDAFAGDNDSMIRLMKMKAELHQSSMGHNADNQLTTDLMQSISSHFKDFFHGTNHGTATIDVNSTHVGSASVEHFKIAIQDTSKHSCNIEFHVNSAGDVSSKISKNEFGDFCAEAFKKSAKIIGKHFSEVALKKDNH